MKFVRPAQLSLVEQHIQEAQLSLTNCTMLFCKVVEVLQDVVRKKFEDMFIRFDIFHERDRQTDKRIDGQTDGQTDRHCMPT